MNGGDQHACCNADGALEVVVRLLLASCTAVSARQPSPTANALHTVIVAVGDLEDDNDVGNLVVVGLVCVGANRGQCIEPLVVHPAAVVHLLLRLCCYAEVMLHVGVLNHHKPPRLLVCAAWGRPGGTNAVLDHCEGVSCMQHGKWRGHEPVRGTGLSLNMRTERRMFISA